MARSDSRLLLAELDNRGIMATGLSVEDVLNCLRLLEKMEEDGWEFKPPKTTNDTGAT